MYQKEIIYMGLFHNDIKEKNAGYLKVDKREDTYHLELQVKNLSGAIAGSFPVRLQSQTGWQEADALVVKDGNGKWSGSAAEQILRAEVIVSDTKRIKGESKFAAAEKKAEETADRTVKPGENGEEKDAAEQKTVEPKIRQKEDSKLQYGGGRKDLSISGNKAESEVIPENGTESGAITENSIPQSIPTQKTLTKAERMPVKRLEHIPLYENKWEQLLTTYEQIHPYGDNRIYVKLEPKDFIVLRENYQHLVNNSFLLHGFYNYRYLILGKEKGFYLGVPGVFYEREKMVALMFGFEAFECEGGEAEEGKFGYYLRKVEL